MADVPTGIARKLQESFRDFLRESAEMIGGYGFLGDCERQLRELEVGIVRPFNLKSSVEHLLRVARMATMPRPASCAKSVFDGEVSRKVAT